MGKESSNKAAGYSSTLQEGGWRLRQYDDLTEQWSTLPGSRRHLFLENMSECGEGWRVVSRKAPPDMSKMKCPPVISGPHSTLEAGKAAYLMALATL